MVLLVLDWACGARKIIDLINLVDTLQCKLNIMPAFRTTCCEYIRHLLRAITPFTQGN